MTQIQLKYLNPLNTFNIKYERTYYIDKSTA